MKVNGREGNFDAREADFTKVASEGWLLEKEGTFDAREADN
jgi:hypothetical protein